MQPNLMRQIAIQIQGRAPAGQDFSRGPRHARDFCVWRSGGVGERSELADIHLVEGLKNFMRRLLFPILGLCLFSFTISQAQNLRIPLPKKSKFTPVQQLNRDGVDALKKHNIDRAKRLFYKAYLVDPNDPFTLNNLGYVSELEGDMERAQRYYDQAQANTSDAEVDKSTSEEAKGQAVAKIAGRTGEGPLNVNQMNSEAI